MSNVGNVIEDLLFNNKHAGPDMTHGLKVLGDGSMQDGMKRVAAFFMKEGKLVGYKAGEKSGVIKGSLGILALETVVAGVWYVVDQHRKRKIHEEEGKIILGTLQNCALEEITREEEMECII